MLSQLAPKDPDVRAKALADALVVATDDGARQSGLAYWYRSRPWMAELVAEVKKLPAGELRDACEGLLSEPGDPARYWRLLELLRGYPRHHREAEGLFDAAWRAECNSRVGFHLGAEYRLDEEDVSLDTLRRPMAASPRAESAPVLVVVPFRDRDTGGQRARNLLACLAALRDQDYPRELYHVTVVEADDEPRWCEVIEPLVDRYVFARCPRSFTKSWAVNVGVVHTGSAAELVCILDADVLCDRSFLSRNVARFERPGTGGHLTYREMFCLDPAASRFAINARIAGAPAVPWSRLRGFLLRRPPGACVWVRAEVFRRIAGMDERYEGWGGEDNDFVYRLDLSAPLDVHHDELLHLHHPPSSQLIDGRGLNDHLPPLSWPADSVIGELDRYGGQP